MSETVAKSQPSALTSSIPETAAKVAVEEQVPSAKSGVAAETSRPLSIPVSDMVDTVPDPTDEVFADESEDFFSYVLMLAIFTVIGILLWWAGVHKHLSKFRGRSTKPRGKYSRVGDEDVEKQMD